MRDAKFNLSNQLLTHQNINTIETQEKLVRHIELFICVEPATTAKWYIRKHDEHFIVAFYKLNSGNIWVVQGLFIKYLNTAWRIFKINTVMRRITTFRSMMGRIYYGGPIKLQYNLIIRTIVLQLPYSIQYNNMLYRFINYQQ